MAVWASRDPGLFLPSKRAILMLLVTVDTPWPPASEFSPRGREEEDVERKHSLVVPGNCPGQVHWHAFGHI